MVHVERPPLEVLTGARFVAATWVMVMHFAVSGALGRIDNGLHGYWLQFTIATGGAAVGFFYILSGFVLAYAHHYQFSGRERVFDVKQYGINRIARIYPTYLVALILTTISASILGLLGALPWKDCRIGSCGVAWLISAASIQAWFPDTIIQQIWNAPGWSVSVEAFFYLLFPFLFRPCVSLASRYRWGAIMVFWMLQNCIFFILNFSINDFDPEFQEGYKWWLERLPLLRLPEFCMGILAWKLWSEASLKTEHFFKHRLVILFFIISLCSIWFIPEQLDCPYWLRPLLRGRAYSLAAPLFTLLIISFACCSGDQRHPINRLLANTILVRLGQASYAEYILHWSVLQFLFISVFPKGNPSVLMGYVAMVLVILAAVAMHRFFELPCKHIIIKAMLRRVGGKRTEPPPEIRTDG